MILETRQTPRFSFVSVDRECIVVAPPGCAAWYTQPPSERLLQLVDDVEGEGNVHRDRRVQAETPVASLEPDAGDVLAYFAGVRQRQAAAVAGDPHAASD